MAPLPTLPHVSSQLSARPRDNVALSTSRLHQPLIGHLPTLWRQIRWVHPWPWLYRYFAPRRYAKYCDGRVCLFVRLRISETSCPNFTKFSVHVTCGRWSVLLWRQCDMLCTSGFVDDVMFSYNAGNRTEWKTTPVFRPVSQVVAPGAKSVVSDCILCCACVTEWLTGDVYSMENVLIC